MNTAAYKRMPLAQANPPASAVFCSDSIVVLRSCPMRERYPVVAESPVREVARKSACARRHRASDVVAYPPVFVGEDLVMRWLWVGVATLGFVMAWTTKSPGVMGLGL